MSELTDDLLRPEAYPPPRPAHVELRETHISWALLTEAEVYKVKKPVRLRFLDFSTLEARRSACEAEVALNTRLAASTYQGITPVRRGPDGRLCFTGDGEVVDWAVRMLRLPDEVRADVRLDRGDLGPKDIDRIAEHVAAFHARCRADDATAAHGAPDAIARNVQENFADTRGVVARFVTDDEAREIERRQLAFVERRADLLRQRCAKGFVREGHGDLRLEHVYLEDDPPAGNGITILDCVEFSESLRCGDVVSDIAFLSMDLAAHGRVDLAERLLAKYARATDDFDLYALSDFYEGYRAYVRAKVATIVATSADDAELRRRAEADARTNFLLALACERRGLLPPVVVAVGGIIASGKSTVADAFADRLAAPVVDADRTRKAMVGVQHAQPLHVGAFQGPYDLSVTDAVYDEMMRRAAVVLTSGRSVILDASFRTAELRRRARDLARRHGVPFLFAECRVSEEVVRARLEERERTGGVSDGRRAILSDFLARVEPATELGDREHLVLDTTRPVATSLEALASRVRTWPAGLVA
jgi:aminoglycoside phosphotransferase family enzyme/predicted kinase